MDDCIERALYLQSAINEFVEKEIDNWQLSNTTELTYSSKSAIAIAATYQS